METTQQPPQIISLEDIATKTFGETQETTPTLAEQMLPTPPEVVTPPKIENVITPPIVEEVQPKATKYSEKIKNLIEDGFLEDVSITLDDKEVFISEIDIQDKDTYDSILESIKSEKKKQREEKYISKEGLDETFLKIVETRKAGGNVNEIIKENVSAIDQLSNLRNTLDSVDVEDKDKEQLAINIVAQNLQQKGLSNKVIQAQIEDFIETGSLETEANTILDSHLELHGQAIEQKKQVELERVEKEKEDFKIFKKTISSTYKEFGLPDAMQKVLVENATKLDEYKISNSDKLYFEAQQKNPDLYAKVNFLLNNPKEFEKWISGKSVTEAKKEIIKSSIVINTNRKKESKSNSLNTLEDIAANTFNK